MFKVNAKGQDEIHSKDKKESVETYSAIPPLKSIRPAPTQLLKDLEMTYLDTGLDNSMKFLYQMVVSTLNIIQPNTWSDFEANIGPLTGNSTWDVSSPGSGNKIGKLLSHWVGYTVCIAVGIMILLLIPTAGVCFCCYKVCGTCKVNSRETSRSRCALRIFTIIMSVITVILIIGVVALFISSTLVGQQLLNRENGTLGNLNKNLKHIDQLKESFISQTRNQVIEDVSRRTQEAEIMMADLPEKAVLTIDQASKASAVLDEVHQFSYSLDMIDEVFERINNTVHKLINDEETLNSSLHEIRNDMREDMNNCTCLPEHCSRLMDLIDSLTIQVDFRKVDSVEDVIETVENASSLNRTLDHVTELLETRSKEIAHSVESKMQNAIEIMENMRLKTEEAFQLVIHDVDSKLNLSHWAQEIANIQDQYISPYGTIIHYGFIGISAIVLLCVFFFILALLCGIFGKVNTKYEWCDRRTAPIALSHGLGLFLSLGMVISAVSLVFFITGGLAQTEVCRYLVNPNYRDQVYPIADKLIQKFGHFSISTRQTFTQCYNNETVYTVFERQLGAEGFNITELTKQHISHLVEELDKIRKDEIYFDEVDIFNSDLECTLGSVQGEFDEIKWGSYFTELKKNVTTYDPVSVRNNICLCRNMCVYAVKLLELQPFISNMSREMESLKLDVLKARMLLDTHNVTRLIKHLKDSEDFINYFGRTILSQMLKHTADELEREMRQLSAEAVGKLRHEIGHCRLMYDDVMAGISAVCIKFLYPLDAFSFILGICLILFLSSVIIAPKLISLYKNVGQVKPKHVKNKPEKVAEEHEMKIWTVHQEMISQTKKVPKEDKSDPDLPPPYDSSEYTIRYPNDFYIEQKSHIPTVLKSTVRIKTLSHRKGSNSKLNEKSQVY